MKERSSPLEIERGTDRLIVEQKLVTKLSKNQKQSSRNKLDLFLKRSQQPYFKQAFMTKSNFFCFTTKQKFPLVAVNKALLYQLESNLQPRHYAALVLGFPILICSMVSSEPVLAGSEFIALMIMMFDRQLSGLVEWLNGQMGIWQVITVISIATILLTQWINPVNAIPSLTDPPQLDVPDFTLLSIKLAIISLNLLLIAVIFFAWRLGAKLLAKKDQ